MDCRMDLNIGLNLKLLVGLVILMQLIQFSAAATDASSIYKISSIPYGTTACIEQFSGWTDWGALVIIAAFISLAYVVLLYFGGKIISDESVVASAKEDMFQVAGTLIIVLIIVGAVKFLCNQSIAEVLLFKDKNLFEAAGGYLENTANWAKSDTLWALGIFWMLNISESLVENINPDSPVIPEGVAESFGFFADRVTLFFSVPFLAYVSILLHLQLLHFVQPLTLNIFLPIGIILRAVAPFRRFGGALIGIAIGLLFMFPFLVALNAVLLQSYFTDHTLTDTDLKCSNSMECLSKVCSTRIGGGGTTIIPSQIGSAGGVTMTSAVTEAYWDGPCVNKKNVGESCGLVLAAEDYGLNGDWQCSSGRCVDGKCANESTLKGTGGTCLSDKDCNIGLWCDVPASAGSALTGTCKEAKTIYSQQTNPIKPETPIDKCSRDSQCGVPGEAYCSGAYCEIALGLNTACNSNEQCQSLLCVNHGCAAVKISGEEFLYETQTRTKSNFLGAISITKKLSDLTSFFVLSVLAGFVVPLINFIILSRAIRDLSGFLGGEIDLASLYTIL